MKGLMGGPSHTLWLEANVSSKGLQQLPLCISGWDSDMVRNENGWVHRLVLGLSYSKFLIKKLFLFFKFKSFNKVDEGLAYGYGHSHPYIQHSICPHSQEARELLCTRMVCHLLTSFGKKEFRVYTTFGKEHKIGFIEK